MTAPGSSTDEMALPTGEAAATHTLSAETASPTGPAPSEAAASAEYAPLVVPAPCVATARPVVSVAILSFNTRQMTLDCLRTLFIDLGDTPADVWVVDNASTDGSVAAIGEAFPAVHVIANDKNVGFGTANNQVMKASAGEFILLINSDAFTKPGAVNAMVNYLRGHPKVGVVGPRLLNRDGSLQQSCFRFPSPAQAWIDNLWMSRAFARHPKFGDYRFWAHDAARDVDWVSGACFMLRREVFEQTGGFDQKFFMYAEEADWQRRIRDQGWEIAFTPDALVTHFGGASGGKDRSRMDRYFFGSLDYYQLKHHGIAGLIALRLAMIVGCSLRTVLWLAVMAVSPGRRDDARGKLRLHSWLVRRQLTHWRVADALRPST